MRVCLSFENRESIVSVSNDILTTFRGATKLRLRSITIKFSMHNCSQYHYKSPARANYPVKRLRFPAVGREISNFIDASASLAPPRRRKSHKK